MDNIARRYRLRVYDGQYEVLADRTYSVFVNLDSPALGGILDRQLVALISEATAENEPMDRPRLVVEDWLTGQRLLDWTGS